MHREIEVLIDPHFQRQVAVRAYLISVNMYVHTILFRCLEMFVSLSSRYMYVYRSTLIKKRVGYEESPLILKCRRRAVKRVGYS